MRKRTLSAATSFAVLVSSAALVAGTAGQAAADSIVPLNVGTIGDMVVDGAHQRLFFSDTYNNRVVVTDFTGRFVQAVDNLPYVRDLDLSADSATLYAAVQNADKIVAIDTAQPGVTAEYPTGEGTKPSTVAAAAGRLWFGYGENWDSELGSVDLTTATPTVALALTTGADWSAPPTLRTDPAAPDTLVAADGTISSGPIVVYDTGSGKPVVRTSTKRDGFVKDIEIAPDGKSVVAADRVTSLTRLSLTDLSEQEHFPVSGSAEKVAVAPDGTVAGQTWDSDDVGDTFVFAGGSATPPSVRDTKAWAAYGTIMYGGIEWAPDSTRLFVPVQEPGQSAYSLRIYTSPKLHTVSVTVKAPATAPINKPLTVSGSIASTLRLPAGTPLTVTRYDAENPAGKALGMRTTASNGTFSFPDTPAAAGKVSYKVAYPGDAKHAYSTGTAAVQVAPFPTYLKLDQNRRTVAYGTNVTYTASLGWTHRNRVVEIWADPYGPEPKRLLKRGTVDSAGKLSVTTRMTRDTWVTADFAGDTRSGRAHVGSTVYTRAGVTTTLSRHYKWSKIGTIWYQTYHQTADPLVTAWNNPYPGRKTKYEVQVWYQGAWRTGGEDYVTLNSGGMAYIAFDGDGAAGIRARVRTGYVDSTSGDNVNTTSFGAWKYFTFTR
ncbi:Ig-like domain repeat protein [Streptomyces sp. TLI_105]|uniref:Ig-like domain repeat protein n=1 Tax=Streptomyces sp. TLI_105 TaxID=1881019 RepID=UPI00210BDC19|nr:Ig-like domain repeat protein [Streptomyces sp. TLI_105]